MRSFIVAVAVLAALPASASAATKVGEQNGPLGPALTQGFFLTVRNTELITPAQRIRITAADGLLTVRDELGGRVDPGTNCRRVGAQTDRVVCDDSVDHIFAVLGDGADTFTNDSALPAIVNGEGGPDTLNGGAASDLLDGAGGDDLLRGEGGGDRLDGSSGDDNLQGGDGFDVVLGEQGDDALNGGNDDDRLDGAEGVDVLAGAAGNDVLIGGRDADDLAGGSGIDLVDYSSHPQPAVTVTLDGLRNDGNAADGGQDLVRADVENVGGSAGNDLIVGSEGPNLLVGRAGNDLIQARGGDDRLFGSAGADTLAGGGGFDTASYTDHSGGVGVTLDDLNNDGNDTDGSAPGGSRGDDVRSDVEDVEGTDASDHLVGNDGANSLRGFGGIDLIEGRGGKDRLLGGDGDDREIDAADGELDEVSCGAGRDFARVDLVDRPADSKFDELPGAPEILPPRDCEGLEIVPFGEQAAVRMRRGAIRVAADRRSVRVRLDCRATAPGGCEGRLLVDALERRGAWRVAARTYAFAAGRSAVLRVKLGRSARRARGLRATALAVGPTGRHHAVIGLVALRR